MDDESEDGYPVGLKLMELANFGAVDLVNPVKSIVLQNKALLALAWYLYQHRLFWTPQEEELLAAHLTPTYLDSKQLAGQRYIKKPIFGREGAGIAIVEPDGALSYEAEECDDCDLIYQQFVPSADVQQEQITVRQPASILIPALIINGKAIGRPLCVCSREKLPAWKHILYLFSMKYKNLRNIRNEYPSISIFFDCCTVPQLYAGCEIS